MNKTRIMFLRALITILGITFLTMLVYQPHALQGHTPAETLHPQRIVSLNLAADEILLALVPPQRIAALTYLADDPHYSNVRAQARAIPARVRANAEQVLALQPDLIIAAAFTNATTQELLRKTGLPLCELQWHDSFNGIEENIFAVGQAVHDIGRARALVETMQQRLQALRHKVADVPRPRVLYYASGGFVAGGGTTMDEMITSAGGLNVAAEAGIRGSTKLSQETLVILNPAVILMSGAPGHTGLRTQLLAEPGLQEIEAIRNKRVQFIPLRYVSTLSHYVVDAVEAIAHALHPHIFVSSEELS